MIKKLFLSFVFVFACVFFVGMNTVHAASFTDITGDTTDKRISYWVRSVDRVGDNLVVDGYGYIEEFQNYRQNNHSFSLMAVPSDGSAGKTYTSANYVTPEDITAKHRYTVGGTYTNCGDNTTKTSSPNCSRIVEYAGFNFKMPLSDFKTDVSYTFYLQITETQSGASRRYQTRIFTPNIEAMDTSYNHKTFHIDSQLSTSKYTVYSDGVMIRSVSPAAGTGLKWYYNGSTWNENTAPKSGYHILYWDNTSRRANPSVFTHLYTLRDYGGTNGWWASSGFKLQSNNNSGNLNSAYYGIDGTDKTGFMFVDYAVFSGTPLTLKITSQKYLGDIQIETKTAPVGNDATVKVTIQNNKDSSGNLNPVNVKIYVDGTLKTNEDASWSGGKTWTLTLPATSANRTIKVVATETIINVGKELSSTLYAASNQVNTVDAVSGTVKGTNPVYVIKTASNTTNYYETITYNQGSLTYYLDDSNSFTRSVSLSYTTDNTAYVSSWNASNISASNWVASPAETYALTKTSSSGTNIAFSGDKTITYIDLNAKDMTTTVSGMGANNITIKMKAQYQFIDATDITEIDSRTHEPNTTGEVYVTIKNYKNRKTHYRIYYKDELIAEDTQTWNGDKKITLTPIVNEADKIRVVIVQPNTITEELSGEVHVSTKEIVDILQDGTYTSPTPIRVVTTPDSVKRYYETFTITSLDKSPTVKGGEGFENRIRIDYSTTENTTSLDCTGVDTNSAFTEKDESLDYVRQADGTFNVPQKKTCTSSRVDTTLPPVVLDKKTGEIYNSGSQPDDIETVDGGNKWYTPMDAPDGNYDFSTNVTDMGVNKVTFVIENDYTIDGNLIGNETSKYKVIRVKNPVSPAFTWHKTYTMAELIDEFR